MTERNVFTLFTLQGGEGVPTLQVWTGGAVPTFSGLDRGYLLSKVWMGGGTHLPRWGVPTFPGAGYLPWYLPRVGTPHLG